MIRFKCKKVSGVLQDSYNIDFTAALPTGNSMHLHHVPAAVLFSLFIPLV